MLRFNTCRRDPYYPEIDIIAEHSALLTVHTAHTYLGIC
jgi:hypothetical protein